MSLSQTLKVERDDDDSFVASVEEVPLQRHVVTTIGNIDLRCYAAGAACGPA